MKRSILSFAVALPICLFLQSLSKMAYGDEKEITILIFEFLAGTCIYWVAWFFLGRIKNI